MLIFTSISRVSSVTITKAKQKNDYFISVFCFLFHNSEENYNFVDNVEMYVLLFEISDRKYCLRDYTILILMNHLI